MFVEVESVSDGFAQRKDNSLLVTTSWFTHIYQLDLKLAVYVSIDEINPIHPYEPREYLAYGILYGCFNTRCYTLVHCFCFFKLFTMGCI